MTKKGLPVALWAAAAVGVTVVATAVITASLGGGTQTLSPDEVSRALDTGPTVTTTTTAPAPTHTRSTTTAPAGAGGEVIGTTPGTVVVRCDGSTATLVSWSPNPGYRADDVVRGPGQKVSVWFESDVANDVKVLATCVDGQPKIEEQVEYDDHGGDDHDDDDHSGRGRGGHG